MASDIAEVLYETGAEKIAAFEQVMPFKGHVPPEKINVFPKRDHVKSKCHLPTIDFVSFQGCIITKCLLFLKESILGTLDPPSWNRYLN